MLHAAPCCYPDDEGKALPEIAKAGSAYRLVSALTHSLLDVSAATESDLAAVLGAMEPERRAMVLGPFVAAAREEAFAAGRASRVRRRAHAEQALAAEHAKVTDLEQRCGEQKQRLNYAETAAVSDAEELAEERAKVARLKDEQAAATHGHHGTRNELERVRERLARLEAFFAEHGVTLEAACLRSDVPSIGARRALSAILATMPKGTKES
jgi:ribosomal protein S8E